MIHRLKAPILRAGRLGISSPKITANNCFKPTVRYFSDVPPVDPTSTIVNAATSIVETAPEKVNFASEGMMQFVEYVHTAAGVPYWEAIALVTIATRVIISPITIQTMKNSAKLAIMRPEMQRIQDMMKDDPNKGDPTQVAKYQAEMKAIYAKYGANPFKALLLPLMQLPLFIGFFIALRNMGANYPDFATGGALWFTDLAASDPYYVLPVINSLSFLIMIEIGADGMATSQAGQFKLIMRGLAAFMIPATSAMPAGLFCYWGVNNVFSILQTAILKREGVRQFFGIPKPPAAEEQPPMKMANFTGKIKSAILNERSKGLDAPAEMLDAPVAAKAAVVPTVTPTTAAAKVADVVTPSHFTQRKKKGKK